MPSQSSLPPRRGKVSVEHGVRGAGKPAFDQIHEQERQIVEHVALGDDGIEFQRVERDRLAVEHRDIAEVKVAMAAPDQARCAARAQKREQFCQGGPRLSFKFVDRLRREQFAVLAERRRVVRDESRNGREPRRGFDRLGACMHGGDGDGELAGERIVKLATLGEMVERVIFVEARHLDRPFDRFARAIQGERPVGFARDRHDAAVELRREFAIDLEFGAAGGFALCQSRIIEKWIAHRALDLDGAVAGQKDDGGMGLAAPHRGAAISRRIAEQLENGGLDAGLAVGGFRGCCHCKRIAAAATI